MGRLPAYILEHAGDLKLDVSILCLEANPTAVAHLRQRFAHEERVTVLEGTLEPWCEEAELEERFAGLSPFLHGTDLVVTELLGCFGDNEFMPELLGAVRRLFLTPGALSIPASYTCYVQPVASAQLDRLFAPGARSAEAGYLLSPPRDTVFLAAQPLQLYQRSCLACEPHLLASVTCEAEAETLTGREGGPVPPRERLAACALPVLI